jgi:predicted SprT family Zn-dependent metalloprotease
LLTVRELADRLALWPRIVAAVERCCDSAADNHVLDRLGRIPVHGSRATSRLGCYVFQGSNPVCIRLQFAQEAAQLAETFLHEVAHACEHLGEPRAGRRLAHGQRWQRWALALGIPPVSRGVSATLAALHHRRRKLVAICQRCNTPIYRVRRLNRSTQYIHPACGGPLVAVPDVADPQD